MSDTEQINPARMLVADLREELARRDLDTSGLKKDLVDRLTAARDITISGGSTTAPPNDEIKAMAQPLGRKNANRGLSEKEIQESKDDEDEDDNKAQASDKVQEEKAASDPKDEGGVGHEMVLGAEERAEEIDEEAEKAVSDSDIQLAPAVLDDEVAAVVAKEEVKATLPPTPERIRSISPLPSSRPRTPPREEGMDQEGGDESSVTIGKRSRSPTGSGSSSLRSKKSSSPKPQIKRRRRTDHLPLPSSLSHLIHPPTCTIYITNLRRPLIHSALHEHLFPSSTPPGPSTRLPTPRQPFASDQYPGLWLSGVKDHAYAIYLSEQDALEAAERLEKGKWPEDTGGELHVEFIDDDELERLVEMEESAWINGRQKLTLKIEKNEDEDTGYKFQLLGGDGNVRNRLPPARPVETARKPPTGPTAQVNSRRAPVAVPLTGSNSLRPTGPAVATGTIKGSDAGKDAPANAPTGPSQPTANRPPFDRGGRGGMMSIRGRGGHNGQNGYGAPPHMNRNGPGIGRDEREIRGVIVPPGVGFGAGKEQDGRLGRPVRRTQVRPFLTWKEGPGAVSNA